MNKPFIKWITLVTLLKVTMVAILFVLTSCSSGWSCKKSYVKSKPYNYKRHHVIKNFDRHIIAKYSKPNP